MIYRVSFLIYEFEFPNNINIYSVIFIIYLKLIPKGSDLYNRSRNDYPAPINEDPYNNVEKKNSGNSKLRNLRIAVRNDTIEAKKLLNI
jgi:hypothetical protein